MLLVLLFACTSPDPDPVDSGSPAVDGPGFEVAASWTADEAFTTLSYAYGLGIPDPFTLGHVYEEAMSHGDTGLDGCPQYEDPNSTSAWGTWFTPGCTSSDGWAFYGTASAYLGTRVVEGGEETSVGGLASWEITSAEGALFIGGGSFGVDVLRAPDGTAVWEGLFGGTWSFPGAEGWMGDGVETALFYAGQSTAEDIEMIVDGGVEHLATDLYYDEVHFHRGACAGWPEGQLRVRDPGGAWFRFTLGEGCDGCGTLLSPDGAEEPRCLDGALDGVGEALFDRWEGL